MPPGLPHLHQQTLPEREYEALFSPTKVWDSLLALGKTYSLAHPFSVGDFLSLCVPNSQNDTNS